MTRRTGQRVRNIGTTVTRTVSGLKGSEKVILAIGGVAVAGVAVWAFLHPGEQGGPCTDPATPCGSCSAPYWRQFNSAFAQYTSYRSQFLVQDSKAGIGFTSAQNTLLQTLQNTMDVASANIGKCVKQYAPSDPIGAISSGINNALSIAASGLAAGFALRQVIIALRTKPITAPAATDVMDNATTRVAIETGQISSASATELSLDARATAASDLVANTTAVDRYVADAVIDQITAQAIIAEDAITIDADLAETLARLALI